MCGMPRGHSRVGGACRDVLLGGAAGQDERMEEVEGREAIEGRSGVPLSAGGEAELGLGLDELLSETATLVPRPSNLD